MKKETLSFILLGIFFMILLFITLPFVTITTLSLMGNDNFLMVAAMLIIIFLTISVLFIFNHRIKFIFISVISLIYAGFIGIINFSFLPMMKEQANIYETAEYSPTFIGPGDFDPTGVDYVLYERLFLICFIILISIAIISISLFIYRTIKEKRTTFKIVNNHEMS